MTPSPTSTEGKLRAALERRGLLSPTLAQAKENPRKAANIARRLKALAIAQGREEE
jgi:hypothetical protein